MAFRPQRVLGRELLDHAPAAVAAANLADIVRINRYFGGHSILRKRLRECFGRQRFSALDVGAASGDLARAAPANATVVCTDLSAQHMARAPHPRIAADAHHLPFADQSFDAVWCSLFLHHFGEDEVVVLLREMRRVARRFVIVMDLNRHWLPYYFLPATRPVFGWLPVTVHDGMASVQAGFTKQEMATLARRAGFPRAVVHLHWLWHRLSVALPVESDLTHPPGF